MKREKNVKLDWQNENLSEWLQRQPPSWAHERILNWEHFYSRIGEHDLQTFTTSIEHKLGAVEMNAVIGQWEHYAGQTWLESVLQPQYREGKMRDTIRLFDDNANYYFDQEQKNDISYVTLDRKNWFSTQGNHRTVVAKFGLAMAEAKTGQHFFFHNMPLTYYSVDWETLELYVSLWETINAFELPISTMVQHHKMHAYGSGHTTGEHFEPVIFITDMRHGERRELYSHLDTITFRQYAEWIIESKGRLSRRDKWAYFRQRMQGKRTDALLYPGSKATPRTGSSQFAQQLQKQWKVRIPQPKSEQEISDIVTRTKGIPSWMR